MNEFAKASLIEKDLGFVISAGRTGTTFLGNMVSKAIEECHSEHEPDDLATDLKLNVRRLRYFGIWHMLLGRILGRTGPRVLGTRYLANSVSSFYCKKKMWAMRTYYYNDLQDELIVESNPQWHYLIELIPEVWPKSKIAVIIRDPRTWIRSWINKGSRHTITDPVRFFPPGRLNPRKVGDDRWTREWHRLDTLGKLAWEWQNVYHRLLGHAEINDRCRIFSYEMLFSSNNNHEMESLIRFLASHDKRTYEYTIPTNFMQTRHHASTGNFPEWQKWHPTQARQVDRLCGDLMRRFGYGQEPLWKSKLLEKSDL